MFLQRERANYLHCMYHMRASVSRNVNVLQDNISEFYVCGHVSQRNLTKPNETHCNVAQRRIYGQNATHPGQWSACGTLRRI